jgi:hypothetical protein
MVRAMAGGADADTVDDDDDDDPPSSVDDYYYYYYDEFDSSMKRS